MTESNTVPPLTARFARPAHEILGDLERALEPRCVWFGCARDRMPQALLCLPHEAQYHRDAADPPLVPHD